MQTEIQFIPAAIMFQSALKNGVNVYSKFGKSNSFTVRKCTNIDQKYTSRDRFSKLRRYNRSLEIVFKNFISKIGL